MARIDNLSNFLTDVADAIKTKKGSQTAIPAANFDTEILALPSQGVYEQKTVNVSANGSQTILPSSGYDAIDELTLTVAVPEKQLQTKEYSFTQNTSIELSPDTGYDGFDTVTININVPSPQINNQDKTITENGVYTADSGYTGIGTATVNVTPPIKMYNTREEMMLDTSEPEHEYGVVYGDKTEDIYEGMTIRSIMINKSITLDEEITSSAYWSTFSGIDFDMNFSISSTYASLSVRVGMEDIIDVQWSSSDGVHYTTDSTESTFDIGIDVVLESEDTSWLPIMGDFYKSRW